MNLTEAEQRIGVSLDDELQSQFGDLKKYHGIKASTEMVRQLIREKHREIFNESSASKTILLTNEDKTFLEVIAQDHWAQFHSFEDKELAESIISNFKKDLSKPKNPNWLLKAIEFCCSLKRN